MPLPQLKAPIQSTAGAVPTRNEKGQITMEKVKVARYVSGKRPEYAPESSDEEDQELEFQVGHKKVTSSLPSVTTEAERDDRRLRRLQEKPEDSDSEAEDDRILRHRRLHEPEVLDEQSESDEEGEIAYRREQEAESSSEDELEEEEIERRRALLRERAKQKREEEEKQEVMDVEEEEKEGSEDESTEWEEYTDSEEDEEAEPRLKPVFVRKKDRITIQEKEREALKQKQQELEAKKMAEIRRKQTLKMVSDVVTKEMAEEKDTQDACDAIDTDDDNDEEEYEIWKIRELKRLKRERDERETLEKDKIETERLRNMTEDERREELKRNPKMLLNKATKGKYRFLQKYFHRGAFYLDKQEDVFTRDFAQPTLEDHFNKTVLPKVMQVKNFGRSGRTKYTHLVDQDSTQFESPWIADTAMNLKFHAEKGGGMKQGFDRPAVKKRK